MPLKIFVIIFIINGADVGVNGVDVRINGADIGINGVDDGINGADVEPIVQILN